MPYCPECGNKISITDKRCSKCGTKLPSATIPGPDDIVKGVKIGSNNPEGKKRHNIEFVLAIITIVLAVLYISQSMDSYHFANIELVYFVLILVFVGVIGAIITRYYAKPGAIILLITIFMLVFCGIQNMYLAIIFAVITAIVSFVLN